MNYSDIPERQDMQRLEKSILAYERDPIEENKILFYGSSCFTRWSKKYGNKPLEECIPGTLNHGFGGSTVHELCYYYDRMVKPYNPRALVITSFLNDYFSGYTNDEIIFLLRYLCDKAKKDFPNIKIFITDYRPANKVRTPEQVMRFKDLNKKVSDYVAENENFRFIELSKEPFYYTDPKYAGTYNNINGSIFIEDNMHFTQEGYDYLTEAMKKALAEVL